MQEFITAADTVDISIDLAFPDGLSSKDGDQGWRVDCAIRYRPHGATGDDAWITVSKPEGSEQSTAVNSWLDDSWFVTLDRLNSTLSDLVDAMSIISVPARLISEALSSALRKQTGALNTSIDAGGAARFQNVYMLRR